MKEWISSIVGVEWAEMVYFAVIACGVVALLLLTLTILKFLRRPVYERGRRGKQARLAVTDAAAIDDRRRLVLLRRDDIEHLILIGGPTDIVIESDIRKNAPARPLSITSSPTGETASRPASQAKPAQPPKSSQPIAPKPTKVPAAVPTAVPATTPTAVPATQIPPQAVPSAPASRPVAAVPNQPNQPNQPNPADPTPVSARLPDQSPKAVEPLEAAITPMAPAPKEVENVPEPTKPTIATLDPKQIQEPKVTTTPNDTAKSSTDDAVERDVIDALLDGITQPRSVAAKSGSN